jgi:two-component system, chemotaxis family, protein-glutamate methylesterase/glutaminase
MATRRRERKGPARSNTAGRGARHDIIVIGASAGGLDALGAVLAALPRDLRATIFIVIHLSAASPGTMPAILAKSCALPIANAREGARIVPGQVWVAPPDRHLLLERGRMRVVRGPRENRHRPAIDPLFRSAAWTYGPRVIGVILSGLLDDGAAGLWAVTSCGGLGVVQDPAGAQYPDMPRQALLQARDALCVPLREIGPRLVELVAQRAKRRRAAPAELAIENAFARRQGGIEDLDGLGQPSPFSCPACRGVLWQVDDGEAIRYRCHTGHAYTRESLGAAQDEATERALNTALRAMHERGASLRRMADQFGHHSGLRRRNLEKAEQLESSAETLRRMLARG